MSYYKKLNPPSEEEIKKCCDLINQSDSILIGAGSGLSVDAGIDYTDQEKFARLFPAMVKRGFRMQYELIGYTDWGPELQWGYWATHINEVRFLTPPHSVYEQLLDIVKEKDYFALTTNVDAMFFKNGFDRNNIYTPQGDYALLQCFKPCTNETWATKPIIDRILPTIDPETLEITDPSLIPECPNCGGPVVFNARGGNWFIEEPYREQAQRFIKWVEKSFEKDLLILEIGSGFNTPGVIRWPMERIMNSHSKSNIIRVNLEHPEVPKEIAGRALSLKCGAMDVISGIWKELNKV